MTVQKGGWDYFQEEGIVEIVVTIIVIEVVDGLMGDVDKEWEN